MVAAAAVTMPEIAAIVGGAEVVLEPAAAAAIALPGHEPTQVAVTGAQVKGI